MMSPKIGGPVAIVLGIAMCGLALYISGDKQVVKLFPSLIGPACIVLGIGMTALPEEKLFKQIGLNERNEPVYDYQKASGKPAMILLLVVGFACSAAFTAALYFGVI